MTISGKINIVFTEITNTNNQNIVRLLFIKILIDHMTKNREGCKRAGLMHIGAI
jgi:hypothetical protein